MQIWQASTGPWSGRHGLMYLVVPEMHDACVERDAFFIYSESLEQLMNYRPGQDCDTLEALVGRGTRVPEGLATLVTDRYTRPELRLPEGM